VRVHVVDPSAFTPPYDHALCSALAAAGADVQLHTSHFAHGDAPAPQGYERHESFYRGATRLHGARTRRLAKLAEHVPEMLRYRLAARAADIVHFQWLPVQTLDAHMLPSGRPLVLTAHDVLPREPAPGQLAAQRRLYERVDAVVAHSEHGRRRLSAELGIDPARIHVIAHGALRPWEGQPPATLPSELRGARGPVVLFFGLLRPYKGLDVLLEAWRGVEVGELWIVGAPRMDIAPLRAAAAERVRWLTRFVSDGELLKLMRRASLVVLPYHEIEQSGVAFTALGAGAPLLLSDVGGFPELAATGAARTFRAGDPLALREAMQALLSNPAALVELAARGGIAAGRDYSWARIAEQTLALYAELG
jgi:glycosyltransferase involved in cell wall biosynthesis